MSKARQTEFRPAAQRQQPQGDREKHLKRMPVLVALITLGGLWLARGFLLELAWAATLATALWPLYRRATAGRKEPVMRALVPLGFTLATALVLMVPIAVVGVEAARDSEQATQWITQAQKSGIPPPQWLRQLPLGSRIVGWWQGHLATPGGASQMLTTIKTGSVAHWTETVATQVASGTWFFAVTLLALFLILYDGERVAANVLATARRFYGEFGERFVDETGAAVRAAVNGTVLVAMGEGTLIGIGYAVTGVPRPLLFTIATIGFAMLPFGAWAAFGVATIILLVQGHVAAAIGLFMFGAAVMLIGDNLVQPALVGNSIKMPFLWIFIATFGGLEQLGVVGLFVGPALMAAVFLVWNEWLGLDLPQRRRESRRRAAHTN